MKTGSDARFLWCLKSWHVLLMREEEKGCCRWENRKRAGGSEPDRLFYKHPNRRPNRCAEGFHERDCWGVSFGASKPAIDRQVWPAWL